MDCLKKYSKWIKVDQFFWTLRKIFHLQTIYPSAIIYLYSSFLIYSLFPYGRMVLMSSYHGLDEGKYQTIYLEILL